MLKVILKFNGTKTTSFLMNFKMFLQTEITQMKMNRENVMILMNMIVQMMTLKKMTVMKS